MTFSDHVFHNYYVCCDIFSNAEIGKYCNLTTATLIAERGLLKLLQLKSNHENNLHFDRTIMDAAAKHGHLNVVKWLHDNRTEGCTTEAMNQAAWKGHLHVVQWLHENRTEGCTGDAIDWAAWDGHLDVVTFLHENRTEGCTLAMYLAAMGGCLRVVQWLYENRSELRTPWSEAGWQDCTKRAINAAAGNGHTEIVQWLKERSSPREN